MQATPTVDRESLVASFCEVAEQSFFAYAEAAGPAAEDVAAVSDWMSATLCFSGPVCGRLTLSLPASLGQELCAAFLGSEPEEPLEAEAVDDLVGEIANMALGAWLTTARRSDCFALSHPDVSRAAAAPAQPFVWMSCNGQWVAIDVVEEVQPS